MIPSGLIKELVDRSPMTHELIAEKAGYPGTRGLQAALYASTNLTFATADRIVCALGDARLWLCEPLSIYYPSIEPPRVCARGECREEFYPESWEPGRLYCSRSCSRKAINDGRREYMRNYMRKYKKWTGIPPSERPGGKNYKKKSVTA